MEKKNVKKQFSTMEVASLLGISRITVFNRIKSGEIVAQKVGRNYVIDKDALDRYLQESELSDELKVKIEKTVKQAVKEYSETFKMLGKE